MTAFERTGWRDKEISLRHRVWGFNCPAIDLDFLVVEYNIGKPVGLIEYKHFKAQPPNILHPSYRALTALADGHSDGPLPFLIVFYWPDTWAFRVTPVNDCAKRNFKSEEILSELDFVKRLYELRSLTLDKYLVGRLNTSLPGEHKEETTKERQKNEIRQMERKITHILNKTTKTTTEEWEYEEEDLFTCENGMKEAERRLQERNPNWYEEF